MIKRLLFIAALLCARPAFAQVACDTTAHSGHTTLCENLTAHHYGADAAWTALTTPSFNTAAGPILFVAFPSTDGANPITSVTGGSLTWTQRNAAGPCDGTAGAAHACNGSTWTAYSATGSLSGVTVSANKASGATTAYLHVYVLSGVGASEAASIGTLVVDGDSTLTGSTAATSITPTASNSWVIGSFDQFHDATVLAASATTTPWDSQFGPAATFTGSMSGTVLTVSAISAGVIEVNAVISGTSVVAATRITSLGTGTGGTGTYNLNNANTVSSEAMTSGPQSDNFARGRAKTSGTVTLTTSGSAITFGSSTTAAEWGAALIEVKAAAGAATQSGWWNWGAN